MVFKRVHVSSLRGRFCKPLSKPFSKLKVWVISLKVLVIASMLFASQTASAMECHIRLEFGLLISPDHIRVMKRGRTQVQINNDTQLFIRGEMMTLTDQEKFLLKEFSRGLRKELPEIVTIAMDSMDLGFDALQKVITGLAGTDAAKETQAQFQHLRNSLLRRFSRSGDNFYIAPQGMDELDQFFSNELSSKISGVVTDSLNVMLGAMGQAYRRSEGAVEGQQTDLDDGVNELTNNVEQALQYNANRLAKKAQAFCERFQTLDKIEARLQNQIPQLRQYDILSNPTQDQN